MVKHFDADGDIDRNSEEFRIDPADSCCELPDDHRARTQHALRKVAELLTDLGVVTADSQRVSPWLGVWQKEAVAKAGWG